jgi:hypothetical protein
MADFLANYGREIGIFLGGLITGVTGGALALRITRSNRIYGSGSMVDQSNASAGGDMTGRDKTVTTSARKRT